MKQLFVTLLLLASTASLHAQGDELPAPDARSLALGGLTMTLPGSSNALYHNPAMSVFTYTPFQLSSSFYRQGNYDFYSVSGSVNVGQHNTLHAGWRQYLRGSGNSDQALDLGYTRRINSEWGLGIVGRYLHLARPGAGSGADALAADLSVAWAHPLPSVGSYSTLRVGAKLANLGGYFGQSDYRLPFNATAGVALDCMVSDAHEVTVGVDAGYCFTPASVRGFRGSVGAEYNLMQLVIFRAGYHYGEKSTYASYGSVGAGVRFLHLRCDVAYILAEKSNPMHNTYSISFGLDF